MTFLSLLLMARLSVILDICFIRIHGTNSDSCVIKSWLLYLKRKEPGGSDEKNVSVAIFLY